MPPVLLMWSTYAWYVACSTFGSTLMTKPMLAAPLTWNSVKPTFTGGLSLTLTGGPEPAAATVAPGLAALVATPAPAGGAAAPTADAAAPGDADGAPAAAALFPLAPALAPSLTSGPVVLAPPDPPVEITWPAADGTAVRRSPTTNGSTNPVSSTPTASP